MDNLDNSTAEENNSMSQENLTDYRIKMLEGNFNEIKEDIKDLRDICIRMDKKLSLIPDSGLPCSVHIVKMDDLTKRVDKVEEITDGNKKSIITWTAVFAVITFLVSQLVIPYALGNYNISPKSPKIEYSIPSSNHFSQK